MGYRKRTGFLAGLTVAQISEFSIVFVAMGITLGHISTQALGLTTLVGLITITLSTYMILYSHPLYEKLAPWLGVFERKTPFRELAVERKPLKVDGIDVMVFGLGRYGSRLLQQLHANGVKVVGIDFDPETVRHLKKRRMPVHYGDGENLDFLESLPMAHTRWVVSTLPTREANRALLHSLKESGFEGRIAVAVRDDQPHEELKQLGVTLLFTPFDDAAAHAAETLLLDLQEATEPAAAPTPPHEPVPVPGK